MLKNFVVPIHLLISLFLIGSAKANDKSQEISKAKPNRVEQFLIWKMSDELKLSSKEEKQFSSIIKEINNSKANLNSAMAKDLETLGKATEAPALKKSLDSYKGNLKKFNSLSEQEFDGMRKLLGDKRLVSYLRFKQDLGDKLKEMISSPEERTSDRTPEQKLPAPKITIEN